MQLDRHIKDAREWYGRIPQVGTPAFTTFLSDATQLIKLVASPNSVHRIVFSMDAMTASADVEQRDITFPAKALVADYYENFSAVKSKSRDMAAVIVGVLTYFGIHEASHLRETPDFFAGTAKSRFARPYIEHNNVLHMLHNIIEDLYIDHQSRKKPYGKFTDLGLEVFFGAEDFEKSAEDFAAAWGKTHVLDRLMELLIGYKHPRDRTHPVWERDELAPIASILQASLDEHDEIERINLTWELYMLLKDLLSENEQQKGKDQTEANDAADRVLDTWNRNISSKTIITSDIQGDPLEVLPNGKMADIRFRLSGREQEEIAKLQEKLDIRNFSDALEKQVAPVERDVLEAGRYCTREIYPDKAFAGFGKILSLLKSTNWTPGPPKKYGQQIINQRLSRINTDGKIFGHPRATTTKNDREVILLVDLSGSMTSDNLIEGVVSAAWGAFESMRQARVRCAVYGHTTEYYASRDQCLVYKIANWGLQGTNTTTIEQRFTAAAAVPNRNNMDGIAIEYVVGKFSKRACPKALIVLSDGSPNGDGYRGRSAMQHTQQAIAAARKRGIAVISLSLRNSVMRDNDELYGREFNICAVGNIDTALRSLVKQISV